MSEIAIQPETRSVEDLKSLYNSELKPHLESMEKIRKKIKLMWYSALTIALILFFVFPSENTSAVEWVYSTLMFIAILFLGGKGLVKYAGYRRDFKKDVVSKVVKFINPDYHYHPDKHISLIDFNQSNMFEMKANRCLGDDFITGKIDKTDFQFSEIKASRQKEVVENNERKTVRENVFTGLFFHADFNKHLNGATFVFPDRAEKLLGKLGQNFQKGGHKGELVKLENPEFEKEYVVFGDQQEARYILTPTMMEAMVNIKKQLKHKLYFSFTGERVYCAIKFKNTLFEPRIKKSGVNYKDVEFMYLLFSLIETIIHEMNLNTRIWTKS